MNFDSSVSDRGHRGGSRFVIRGPGFYLNVVGHNCKYSKTILSDELRAAWARIIYTRLCLQVEYIHLEEDSSIVIGYI